MLSVQACVHQTNRLMNCRWDFINSMSGRNGSQETEDSHTSCSGGWLGNRPLSAKMPAVHSNRRSSIATRPGSCACWHTRRQSTEKRLLLRAGHYERDLDRCKGLGLALYSSSLVRFVLCLSLQCSVPTWCVCLDPHQPVKK